MRDVMVLLETQGNVYMVGDLIFINPEVVGKLMVKLVDHSLKERVLNNDSEMMEALEGISTEDNCEDSHQLLNSGIQTKIPERPKS